MNIQAMYLICTIPKVKIRYGFLEFQCRTKRGLYWSRIDEIVAILKSALPDSPGKAFARVSVSITDEHILNLKWS